MGDEKAFSRLVEQYAPVIWTVINRMNNGGVPSEDLFQESVIRIWRGLPGFKGTSKISTWLYKIAYRVCLDSIESTKRKRTDSLDEHLEVNGFEPSDESHSGDKIENRVAAKDAVVRGLESLQPEWRTIVTLYYWRGMSLEEISKIVDRPVNTVKVYLHRARASLRDVLKAGGYPNG
jgi:RNA polymerase sigma-70 factor, ECF subfamily